MARYMNILSILLINGLLLGGCTAKEAPDTGGSGKDEKPQTGTEAPDFDMLLNFEGKAEPISCGRNIVKRFIEVPNSNWGRTDKSPSSLVTYPDVCEWLGAFWFLEAAVDNAILTGDETARREAISLMQGIVDRYDDVITGKTTFGSGTPLYTGLLWRNEHNRVDYYIWGAISLHIASIMENPKYNEVDFPQTRAEYLEFGLQYADNQFHPYTMEEFQTRFSNAADYDLGRVDPSKNYKLDASTYSGWKKYLDQGCSWQTRLWLDDMFMITALQVQAYYATKDDPACSTDPWRPSKTNSQNRYLDRAVREMVLYANELQGSQGLYWHATNAKQFWARGNGWMAVGMPLMLEIIEDIPDYAAEAALLREEYNDMMTGLYIYQKKDEAGLWAQLIDHTDMWTETSGSGMFTFAFITGVRNGWLDSEIYGEAAAKAWKGLVSYLDDNYDLREVCAGTAAGSSVSHYENAERTTGDTHGQAAMLWCTYALTLLENAVESGL